ncbi:hypothetical protein ATL31_1937 [Phycicoccus duodecadis]|uniref:Uncharacterized protein n=1 Tax=Phycicoccus duodecadis TaxID=173053 RepID=A0A2N3YJQ0_9MICO|nr:hypothetical protein ATL31_1937 [Phycicoccus duodecadis]
MVRPGPAGVNARNHAGADGGLGRRETLGP